MKIKWECNITIVYLQRCTHISFTTLRSHLFWNSTINLYNHADASQLYEANNQQKVQVIFYMVVRFIKSAYVEKITLVTIIR